MTLIARTLITAMVVSTALVSSVSDAAAADRRVKIVNHTSVTLERFYGSLTNTQSWGPDRLVSRVIPSNYSATIDFNRDRSGCFFDFRAVFADGDVLEEYGVDVCSIGTFTYYE